MSNKTETITLTVTETTVHQRTLSVTPALLDEAEAEGYERNVYGVANMLDDSDGDHWEVVNTVRPAYFDSVTERSATTEVA